MGQLDNLLPAPVPAVLLVKKQGKKIPAMMNHGRERVLVQVVEEGEDEVGPTELQLRLIQTHQVKGIDKQGSREQQNPPDLHLPPIHTHQLIPDIQNLHAQGPILAPPEVLSRVLHLHPILIICLLIDE